MDSVQSLELDYRIFPCTVTSLLLRSASHTLITDAHACEHTHTKLTLCQYIYFDDVHCGPWNPEKHAILGSSLPIKNIVDFITWITNKINNITIVGDVLFATFNTSIHFLTSIKCDCSNASIRAGHHLFLEEIESIFSTQETWCQWPYLPGNLISNRDLKRNECIEISSKWKQ